MAAAPSHGQARPGARLQQHHAGDWLRRYKDLPPDQQMRALENDPEFRNLPRWRQQALRQRLQRFNSLTPQQRQRILNRIEVWEHLTPEQKGEAVQLARQWRDLPPARRELMKGAIRDLQKMPPDQRQQALDSNVYRNQFTPQERDILRGVAKLPLAPADGGEGGMESEAPTQ